MVPDRGFAFTVLTNSEGGPKLLSELFTGDWALRRFAAVRNLQALPKTLNPSELASYEGLYTGQSIGTTGAVEQSEVQLTADRDALSMKITPGSDITQLRLTFYGSDHVVCLEPDRALIHMRAGLVRGPSGSIQWLRLGGRLYRRQS